MLFKYFALASVVGYAAATRVCSSENTGSSFSAATNIYNTAGSCVNTCGKDYEYGVLQDNKCWCTNSLPSDTVDVSKCDEPCPGYPQEDCGSKSANLYTYFPINNDTDAIVGASQTAPYTGSVTWTGSVSATGMSTVATNSASATPSANATTISFGSSNGTVTGGSNNGGNNASASSTAFVGGANKGISFSMGATGLVLGAAALML